MQSQWIKCNDCFCFINEDQVYYKCLSCADTDICSGCFARTGISLSSSSSVDNNQQECQHQHKRLQLPQDSCHKHHVLLKVVGDDTTTNMDVENIDSNSVNYNNSNDSNAARFSAMTLLDGLEVYSFYFDQIALCTGLSSLEIMEQLNNLLHSGTSPFIHVNGYNNGKNEKKNLRNQITDGMNRKIMLNESKRRNKEAYFAQNDTLARIDRFSSLLMNIYNKRRQKESWSSMVFVLNAVMKKGKLMGNERKTWKKLNKIVYTTSHRRQTEELLQKFRKKVISSLPNKSSSSTKPKLGGFLSSSVIFNDIKK